MQRFLTVAIFPVFAALACALTLPAPALAQKQLAPGVLQTIPSDLNARDSFSLPLHLPGLDAPEYNPNYLPKNETLHDLGERAVMFRDVWEYEFSFIGQLRQAQLVVPNLKTGATETRNVWYLIYRIRDLGKTLTYDQVKQSPEFEHIEHKLIVDAPVPPDERFFLPRFKLEGWVSPNSKAGYQKVTYSDKVSPMVLRQIQRRQDPGMKLLDSVSMSKTKIPLAKTDADGGVWGVAIFENVDPRLDYVSVYVSGLTNAFRIGRPPGQPNKMKTLQLNFWRPGDIFDEHNDEIDFGIPLVDNQQKQILITKRYDLPGPLLRGYHIDTKAANYPVLIAEVDAQFSLETFRSDLTPTLDSGKFPETVAAAFKEAGVDVTPQTSVTTVVPGKAWVFTVGDEKYTLGLEPQYWERKNDESIRFLKTLDYLWLYR